VEDVDDYYGILGVAPHAEPRQIKAAYRYKANILHPDRLARMPEQVRYRAEEELKKVNKAYEVLSDLRRRQQYDARLDAARVPSAPIQEPEPRYSAEELVTELYVAAAEKFAQGASKRQVFKSLRARGVPREIAIQITVDVDNYIKALKRRGALKGIGCGVLMLAVGAIVTGVTYAAASGGGYYLVTTGLFIAGAIAIVVGLYRLLTGR